MTTQNKTARLSEYEIVEIIKQTAKQSVVKVLTDLRQKVKTVKNKDLRLDPIITLTEDNAHKVATVVSINNPQWGVKRFNYNNQDLLGGERCSTVGSGANISVLFKDDYKFWRVVSFKN